MERSERYPGGETAASLSARLSRGRRSLGGRGRRVPAWVWDAAVDLARIEGVGAVARRLRLDPDSLGGRLAELDERRVAQRLLPTRRSSRSNLSRGPSECVVEGRLGRGRQA